MGLVPRSGKSPGGGQPTPIFLPGKFHGQRSLMGYSPWGYKESDMPEHACLRTHTHFSNICLWFILSLGLPDKIFGNHLYWNVFIIYLKFKFHQASCFCFYFLNLATQCISSLSILYRLYLLKCVPLPWVLEVPCRKGPCLFFWWRVVGWWDKNYIFFLNLHIPTGW